MATTAAADLRGELVHFLGERQLSLFALLHLVLSLCLCQRTANAMMHRMKHSRERAAMGTYQLVLRGLRLFLARRQLRLQCFHTFIQWLQHDRQ